MRQIRSRTLKEQRSIKNDPRGHAMTRIMGNLVHPNDDDHGIHHRLVGGGVLCRRGRTLHT